MKKYLLTLVFVISTTGLQAQKNAEQQEVKVGDVLQIGKPKALQYKYIDFPRPNFIIKRGGLANYDRVFGNRVVVTSVKQKKDGTIKVRLKRADGGRFFGSHSQVAANFREALKSGELRTL
ncbi:hypothetical protein [Maribacter sp. ACAM166]|uniref:hypothetical protein n=1 Tax=Maribacter sp. ACAM166 TaxID=2508996 RepID=UPI0010FDDFFB|nr:hypothetical protein [Maribacter sp. ACAM166]TLP81753.1 hypothetical protein ES765_03465 [Maribacter sp. ACAM166]